MPMSEKISNYKRRQIYATGRKGHPPVFGALYDLYRLAYEVRGARLIDSPKCIPDARFRACVQYALLNQAERALYRSAEEYYNIKRQALSIVKRSAVKGIKGFTMEKAMQQITNNRSI